MYRNWKRIKGTSCFWKSILNSYGNIYSRFIISVGIILNKIIEEKSIKADGERVRKIIEDRAAMYKEPQQVVNWFYSNEEQLRSIESISLEEQVIEILLSEASAVEEELTYEECVSG